MLNFPLQKFEAPARKKRPHFESDRQFPPVFAALALVLAVSSTLFSQDSDTLILENSRAHTILDEISDPAERAACLEIYRARTPRDKAQKAEAFLVQFPQSWLLAEIYEIAAKAYIDLGDFERALQDGRASLQILPESPLLLTSLADVEAKLGLTTETQQSAEDALNYLERFGRPASIPEESWPDQLRELKASCFFVLGRVKTVEATSLEAGQERSQKLADSIDFLRQAKDLNPHDTEIDYLLGLDYLAMRNSNEAAKWMAIVSRGEGPLKEMATAKLIGIFAQSGMNKKQTFEEFRASLVQPSLASFAPGHGPARRNDNLSDYVGSKTCATCHRAAYQYWSHTGMAQMLRPYAPQNILGDFAKDNTFYLDDDVVREGGVYKFIPGQQREPFARMIVDHGQHYFEIKQSDHLWHWYPVNYTIGSKWQQGYVTRLSDGRLQVLPIQYNLRYKKWVNFWKIIDEPGAMRDDPLLWEKFSPATDYLINCAWCHTSQLRNLKGGGFDARNLEFREPGIDCEMCHGPGGRHVASLISAKIYKKDPLDPPVDFTKISSRQSVAICAQCHMQSAIRVPGSKGELNYSRDGGVFFRTFKSRPYGEFFTNARYKDGRFRQTTFIVESFLRTKCFTKGGATCNSCHDSHAEDSASNPTLLRFRDLPNQMCTQCHAQFKDVNALQQHTRHPLESEGSQCVSCHMPRIMESLMALARTHRIDDKPDARMTERFGEQDSPNACLICHTNRNIPWVARELGRWNTHSARPSAERGRT